MTDSSFGHLPGERWAFDAGVASVFDDMLARSIPQLPVMRELVSDLAARHAMPDTCMIDLGCSRGEALVKAAAAARKRIGDARLDLVGFEVSEPMLDAARVRAPEARIEHVDLRTWVADPQAASVVLSVLTLQFVPINYRQQILHQCRRAIRPGGALIVVEKVLGQGVRIDDQMIDAYHRHKLSEGYTQEEIDRKKLALEGVLVPVTAAWNEDMLRKAGFVEVDCFWRWLNFAGWIALT